MSGPRLMLELVDQGLPLVVKCRVCKAPVYHIQVLRPSASGVILIPCDEKTSFAVNDQLILTEHVCSVTPTDKQLEVVRGFRQAAYRAIAALRDLGPDPLGSGQ